MRVGGERRGAELVSDCGRVDEGEGGRGVRVRLKLRVRLRIGASERVEFFPIALE